MGVFTLSNKPLNEKAVSEIYMSRGHRKVSSYQQDGLNILYSNKILFDNDNFYQDGKNYILGIGTFFYKSLHGLEALKQILKDFNEELIVEQNPIYGHYAFVVGWGGQNMSLQTCREPFDCMKRMKVRKA